MNENSDDLIFSLNTALLSSQAYVGELETKNSFLGLKLKLQTRHSQTESKEMCAQIAKLEKDVIMLMRLNKAVSSNIGSPSNQNVSLVQSPKPPPPPPPPAADEAALKKIAELTTTLGNLSWGFRKREDDLRSRLILHKDTVVTLNATEVIVRDSLRNVCENLCEELSNVETFIDTWVEPIDVDADGDTLADSDLFPDGAVSSSYAAGGSAFAHSEAAVMRLEKKVAALTLDLKTAREDLRTSHQEFNELLDNRNQLVAEKESLERDKEVLEHELTALQMEAYEKSEQAEQEKRAQEKFDREARIAEEELSAFRQRGDVSRERDLLKEAAEDTKSELQRVVVEMEEQKRYYENQIDEIKRSIQRDALKRSAQTSFSDMDDENDTLRRQVAELKESLALLKADTAASAAECIELTVALGAKHEEAEALKYQVAELMAQHKMQLMMSPSGMRNAMNGVPESTTPKRATGGLGFGAIDFFGGFAKSSVGGGTGGGGNSVGVVNSSGNGNVASSGTGTASASVGSVGSSSYLDGTLAFITKTRATTTVSYEQQEKVREGKKSHGEYKGYKDYRATGIPPPHPCAEAPLPPTHSGGDGIDIDATTSVAVNSSSGVQGGTQVRHLGTAPGGLGYFNVENTSGGPGHSNGDSNSDSNGNSSSDGNRNRGWNENSGNSDSGVSARAGARDGHSRYRDSGYSPLKRLSDALVSISPVHALPSEVNADGELLGVGSLENFAVGSQQQGQGRESMHGEYDNDVRDSTSIRGQEQEQGQEQGSEGDAEMDAAAREELLLLAFEEVKEVLAAELSQIQDTCAHVELDPRGSANELSIIAEAAGRNISNVFEDIIRVAVNEFQTLRKSRLGLELEIQSCRNKIAQISTKAADDAATCRSIMELQRQENEDKIAFFENDRIQNAQMVEDATMQMDKLLNLIEAKDDELAALAQALEVKDDKLATLIEASNERNEQLAALTQASNDKDAQLDARDAELNQLDNRVAQLEEELQEARESQRGGDDDSSDGGGPDNQLEIQLLKQNLQVKKLEMSTLLAERDEYIEQAIKAALASAESLSVGNTGGGGVSVNGVRAVECGRISGGDAEKAKEQQMKESLMARNFEIATLEQQLSQQETELEELHQQLSQQGIELEETALARRAAEEELAEFRSSEQQHWRDVVAEKDSTLQALQLMVANMERERVQYEEEFTTRVANKVAESIAEMKAGLDFSLNISAIDPATNASFGASSSSSASSSTVGDAGTNTAGLGTAGVGTTGGGDAILTVGSIPNPKKCAVCNKWFTSADIKSTILNGGYVHNYCATVSTTSASISKGAVAVASAGGGGGGVTVSLELRRLQSLLDETRSRELELQATVSMLQQQLVDTTSRESELQDTVASLQGKLLSLQELVDSLSTESKSPGPTLQQAQSSHPVVSISSSSSSSGSVNGSVNGGCSTGYDAAALHAAILCTRRILVDMKAVITTTTSSSSSSEFNRDEPSSADPVIHAVVDFFGDNEPGINDKDGRQVEEDSLVTELTELNETVKCILRSYSHMQSDTTRTQSELQQARASISVLEHRCSELSAISPGSGASVHVGFGDMSDEAIISPGTATSKGVRDDNMAVLSSIMTANDDLIAQVEDLTVQLQDSRDRHRETLTAADELKENLREATKQKLLQDNQKKQISEALEAARVTVESYDEEVQAAKTIVDELTLRLEASEDELARFREERKFLHNTSSSDQPITLSFFENETSVSALNHSHKDTLGVDSVDELEKSRTIVQDLTQKLADYEEELDLANDEILDLSQQLKDCEDKLREAHLHTAVTGAGAGTAGIHAVLNAAAMSVAAPAARLDADIVDTDRDTQEELREALADVHELQQRVEDCEGELQQARADIEDLTAQVRDLEEECSSLRAGF